MSVRPPGRTLRVELSLWLAVQSLLVLTLVSALVFAAIDRHLQKSQNAHLQDMELLVVRLIATTDPLVDLAGLSHLLGGLVAGYDKFRLELADESGLSVPVHPVGDYAATSPLADGDGRLHSFVLELPGRPSNPIRVRLSLDIREEQRLLRQLGLTLASAVVVGTLLNSAAALWRVSRSLAPVARLGEQIDRLDAERLPRHLLDAGQPAELRPLVERFNELLDRLDLAYRRMAAFDADVAHELNTPIATLMTSNELALRNEAQPLELQSLLGSNLEELERLRTIVRDMLFLSLSERGARARTNAVPSLANLARTVVELHDAALDAANVNIEIRGDANAEVDTGLLERALSNLIDNATRHAHPGSLISIDVEPMDSGSESEVRMTVSNEGATIPTDALSRLFDRFYRLTDERSDRDGGGRDAAIPRRHGLGLSIVAAIARMHGGRTVARSAAGITTMGLVVPIGARRADSPPRASALTSS